MQAETDWLSLTKEEQSQVNREVEEGENMLKQYEIRLPQADIEFLDGCLESYAEMHPQSGEEVDELRLMLNFVLICETTECENKRQGLEDRCAECIEVREDARRTFQGAVQAGMIEGV